MVANESATAFYKVNTDTATESNSFPVNGIAGCLMVINLYGTHVIQVYFAMSGAIYVRSKNNYSQVGSTWEKWKQISMT